MPTLLLADDSVTIQRVIELTFAEQGMRVVSVGDGESAIARMTAERPDIVLADVGMRRVDGYQVAAHMKRTPALAQVPVLLLTGAFEPIDEDRARRAGCDGVLVKPFEPRQVLAQVRALLSGHRPADLWPADMPRVDPRPARPPQAAPADGSNLLPPRGQSLELSPPRSAPAFETMSEPGPVPSAPPAEAAFELGLDDLDLAFSRLDPVAAPGKLDAETVSDFQRDIHELRSAAPEEPREPAANAPSHFAEDMEWDLPAKPARAPELELEPVSLDEAAPPLAPPPEPAPVVFVPPPPPPPPPVPEPTPEPEPKPEPEPEPAPAPAPVVFVPPPAPVPVPAPVPPTPPPPPAPQQPPPSLASAFSALLAAEQTQPQLRPSAAGSPALSDAAVEEVVKRVVTRMTDEVVRKVVLETAERLIREEIDRIKS